MRPSHAARLALHGAIVAAAASSCAGRPAPPASSPSTSFGRFERRGDLRAPVDPMVHGARLFPSSLGDEAHEAQAAQGPAPWGVEPGGGVRAIVAGLRVVSSPDGAMAVASQRLPGTPSTLVALPERLGGGFLFALSTHVWRAPSWLAEAAPVYASPSPIATILIGLDRAYVRTPTGALGAFDPATGQVLDLGPLPSSPQVSRLAALDAWRAVAIADMRGPLLTLNAGSSWQPLALPIDPTEVVLRGDALAIVGTTASRRPEVWEVRADGDVGRVGLLDAASPSATEHRALSPSPLAGPAPSLATKTFGARPLLAALEDGWPLVDGTALVARDGALGRVRLADGALVDTAPDAFPLRPSRCHPISLAPLSPAGEPPAGVAPSDPASASGAFGFVCGEARGRTRVYRWDPAGGRMVEIRAFDEPREVLGFGNGALAVRGPCASDSAHAPPAPPGASGQLWCVMRPRASGPEWQEIALAGEDVERARLVVLSDGRVAVLRPPDAGDLGTASLTIVDGPRTTSVPLRLPKLRPDVARTLRTGVWLDGFEERRLGVLGGWVDAAGTVLGLEVSVDGTVTVGELIREAGAPVVAGRWGLGWTASRRGFETTDGGMTWSKGLDLPEPIATGRAVHERACGPIGCIAAGWLRVGWNESSPPPSHDLLPPAAPVPARALPPLRLVCDPLAGPPPELKALAALPRPSPAAGLRIGGRVLVSSGSTWAAVSALPSFAGRAGPAMAADDVGLNVDVSSTVYRAVHGIPLARAYAWGPRSGDWDALGRWEVRWQWPWGGWSDARASSSSAASWPTFESARRALGLEAGSSILWTLAPGDDAEHALLVGRPSSNGQPAQLIALEAGRAPTEVPRGTERAADVDDAVRMAGVWYVATPQGPSELEATVLWSLDGAGLHELARIPRNGGPGRSARLARGADARSLGIVVQGQPDASRRPLLWLSSVDVETGAVGAPQPLVTDDFSGLRASPCTGDDDGWQLDVAYPGTIEIAAGAWSATLSSPSARVRLSRDHLCVERVLGSADGFSAVAPGALFSATGASAAGRRGSRVEGARTIDVNVFAARLRYPLRCAEQ